MNLMQFREALVRHLHQSLTPERMAQIEAEAFANPERHHDPTRFGTTTCGSLVFAVERFQEVLPELRRLHEMHWAETEGYRHAIAMDPDYEHMAHAEHAGRMLQFTARTDGQLVGHQRWYVHTSTHTRTPYAGEDALYLVPEARGGRTAVRFLSFALNCMRQLGLEEFRATSKVGHEAGARLFEHVGFVKSADQWTLIFKE